MSKMYQYAMDPVRGGGFVVKVSPGEFPELGYAGEN
jgi:hypothetical protein